MSTKTYDYWRAALKGEFGPVHDGDAQPGFWRKRTSRAGPFVPVAIWEQDGKLIGLIDGKPTDDPADIWTYVCRYPITKAQYDQRVETGKWHDEDNGVAESLPTQGHNNPPDDPVQDLADAIASASANAAEYEEIHDDETAAKAQSVRSRLLELSGQADAKREVEKAPHLEAGRAIDAKWNPLVKGAKSVADKIKAALSAHETRKLQARQKAEAEAEERRVKAERERVKAAAKGKPLPPEPAPAPAPEPVQTSVRGAYGRAAAIKAVKVAKVVDQDALYPFLKTHPEMVDLMAKLAQRAVTAGLNPPGVEITEEAKVA